MTHMPSVNTEFQPFNNPVVERSGHQSNDKNAVHEVMWSCPECSHNSYAASSSTPGSFDPSKYDGKDEICPMCSQPAEGQASQYFLGPLVSPKVDHWINGEPA